MTFRLLGAAALCGALVLTGTIAAPAADAPAPQARATLSPAAFDAIGERALASNTAPGFVLAVVRGGRAVYARGFGVANVARSVPVTPRTRFAIGSLSKQFTATAVLRLRDAGKLGLDDRLATYVPSLPNANAITLRMLLNQNSGLHNFPLTTEHAWPLQGAIDPQRIIDILATDKPDFEPGTKWAYSNANYAALAYVAARTSGMPYGRYLARTIFTPLGMTSSADGYAAQQAGTATPYEGTGTFTVPEPPLSLDLFYGAGGIVSTADDMVRWDAALMRGTLLGAASMHDLWTAGTLANGKPVRYAMGFVPSTLDGHREVWHNGLTPYAGGYCYNAIFPDDDLAVIVLSNGAGFRNQPEAMVREVLAAYFR